MGEELRGELMSSLVGTNGRDLRTKTAKATNADATPTYFPTSIPTYYPTALGDGAVEGEAADSNSVKARGKNKKADYAYDYDYDYDKAGKSGKSGSPEDFECDLSCLPTLCPGPSPITLAPARTCPSSSLAASASAAAACQRTAPTRMPRAAAMPTSPSRACATSMTADFHPPACARSCPSPSPMGSAPATAPPTTPAPTMPLKPIAVAPSSPLVAAPATTAATPSLPCLPPTFPRACPRMCPLPCLSRRWPPLSPQQAARRRSVRRSRVRRRRVEETRVCRSTEPQWIPEEKMLKASFSIGSSLMLEWICGSTCVQRIAHHLPVFIQADTLQAIA